MPSQIRTAGTISQSKPLIKKNKNPAMPKRLSNLAKLDFCLNGSVSLILSNNISLFDETFQIRRILVFLKK